MRDAVLCPGSKLPPLAGPGTCLAGLGPRAAGGYPPPRRPTAFALRSAIEAFAAGLRRLGPVLSLALALSGADHALAQEAPTLIDSKVWQERFREWVEQQLVRDQIDAAAENLPTLDRRLVLRVLDRLEDDLLISLREVPSLPEDALVKMLGRGLDGPALVSARLFADGQTAQALEILGTPELAEDPPTQHLRAQLLDNLSADLPPLYRLQVIELYREALRLDGELPQANRARLRIGQIYLELRFAKEARAALRTLLERDLPESYRRAARLSLAEAAYVDRAPVRAIEHLAMIDLEAISPATHDWVSRRHADSLVKLERYEEAIALYRRVLRADVPLEPLVAVNLAFALLHTREWRAAPELLDPIVAGTASRPTRAIAAMLLARAQRRLVSFKEASQSATRATELAPGTEVAALAAVETLEAERALHNDSIPLPPGTALLVQSTTFIPAVGLLTYLAQAAPSPGDTPQEQRRRLGSLAVTLPPGIVQHLAYTDLVTWLASDLARIATRQIEPDPSVLADTGRYLRPQTMDEDVLLLAIESQMLAGDHNRCARWARTLQRREPRPLRRGIGTWREVTCRLPGAEDVNAARRMMVLADSRAAGPFALAVAAIAAETYVQRGDLERAALTFARAVESFSEPTFVGPVLLRLGEIEVALGQDALALNRLSRGLTLSDAPDAASEPFRKAGIVALARVAARSEKPERALRLLQAEHDRAEDWWAEAYAYLLLHTGATDPPKGDSLFARGARAQDEIKTMRARLQRVQRRRARNRRPRPARNGQPPGHNTPRPVQPPPANASTARHGNPQAPQSGARSEGRRPERRWVARGRPRAGSHKT